VQVSSVPTTSCRAASRAVAAAVCSDQNKYPYWMIPKTISRITGTVMPNSNAADPRSRARLLSRPITAPA
jgi:hypothetical protein